MLRNRFTFTRSITHKWMISYAVILLIPLIVSAIVYLQTTQIVQYEIKRASSAMLQQVKYIVDSELGLTEKMGAQLTIQTDVRNYLELDKQSENAHAFDIYKTEQELGKYKSTNDFISGIYIYSTQLDKVLSNETYADSRLFYAMNHQSDTYTYSEWLSDMRSQSLRTYLWLPMRSSEPSGMNVAFIKPLLKKAGGLPYGTLVMPLNSSKIQHLLENVDWVNKGKVYIVDEQNQVLFQNGSAEASVTYADLIADTNNMVTTIESDNTNWRYVSVFPSSVFWERASQLRTMNVIGLLVCFLIGGGVMTYFARRNYVPIKQLLSILPNFKPERKAEMDEYAFIRQSVMTAIRERDDMSSHQLKQLRVLQSYYLGKLLKGQTEQAMSVREAASIHRMDWLSEDFAVLLFYLDPGHEKGLPLNLSQFIVSNIVKDLVDRRHNVLFTDVDGMLAAIVNIHPERNGSWKEEIEGAISEAHEFIEQRYALTFSVSGSEANPSLEGIHQAFLQALEAQEYRMMQEEKFVWYGDIKLEEADYYYSMNEELQLHNLIKSGNFEKAAELVDGMIGSIFQQQASIEMVKCFLIDLASTMIKMVPQEARRTSFWEEQRPVKRLLACTTRAEFRQELMEILAIVCELVNEKLALASNTRIGEQVAAYVAEHYADVNLSVSMIGAHFGITPQYVSKVFKEHNGEGLHEYISQTRIRQAKQLLGGGAQIDETALAVGFASSSAFIRVFKKYEGITPGKYKTIQL
ncbi:AraC-like DNA-binding protein [Paenibacillus phyllosphaerae]|uniref:AraC-like DNA-binding protein n=1 Tax=Paenibacillus phyllosphaerae TaxID=274593 RepID=A0A7W5B1R8_9BACL|nr:helix-turn-helix domain-containing protein [Paenibacillus phyllosphaerae]MBB3112849.1 AraC-like DNA-binding protein [Paenibacillus phyllosphaerae]